MTSETSASDSLKRILHEMSQGVEEHSLALEEIEAIWAMGLSAFFTGRGFGMMLTNE